MVMILGHGDLVLLVDLSRGGAVEVVGPDLLIAVEELEQGLEEVNDESVKNDKGCAILQFFVNEIHIFVRNYQVHNLFVQYEDLLNVFLQRTKKVGSCFWFGSCGSCLRIMIWR